MPGATAKAIDSSLGASTKRGPAESFLICLKGIELAANRHSSPFLRIQREAPSSFQQYHCDSLGTKKFHIRSIISYVEYSIKRIERNSHYFIAPVRVWIGEHRFKSEVMSSGLNQCQLGSLERGARFEGIARCRKTLLYRAKHCKYL